MTAQTTVKGAGSYRLRLSNCDHEVLLWINGSVATFNGPTTYDTDELVDPYWLFAAFAGEAADEEAQPVCAIPAGDPWMDNILRPLIESLGYRVVAAEPGAVADVTIAAAEAEPASVAADGVLRIRSRADSDAGGDSIYRYDRAALIGALARRGKERRHG